MGQAASSNKSLSVSTKTRALSWRFPDHFTVAPSLIQIGHSIDDAKFHQINLIYRLTLEKPLALTQDQLTTLMLNTGLAVASAEEAKSTGKVSVSSFQLFFCGTLARTDSMQLLTTLALISSSDLSVKLEWILQIFQVSSYRQRALGPDEATLMFRTVALSALQVTRISAMLGGQERSVVSEMDQLVSLVRKSMASFEELTKVLFQDQETMEYRAIHHAIGTNATTQEFISKWQSALGALLLPNEVPDLLTPADSETG